MRKSIILISLFIFLNTYSALAEEKPIKTDVKVSPEQYSVTVSIKDIPEGQQTLFIPIKIDTTVLDFDKVALEGLSTQNILAVTSSSKDKVGPGIGLLKLDENGLPPNLTLKVFLKPVGQGQTSISLIKVADEPALPSKGTVLNDGIAVNIKSNNDIEVTEKTENNKKKLVLSENKLTLSIQRPAQKEESIFIPVILDKNVVDLDETFGHAIVGPGIAAKAFSSGSLSEGGTGVEILLTEVAEKDFTVDLDLAPKKVGKTKITTAFPQKGHTAIVSGPQVEINPTSISVVNNPDTSGK